ncbi:Uncharacterized protein QTN25_004562 [Entamoeba marina]
MESNDHNSPVMENVIDSNKIQENSMEIINEVDNEIQVMDEEFTKQLEEDVIREAEQKKTQVEPELIDENVMDEDDEDLFQTHEFQSRPTLLKPSLTPSRCIPFSTDSPSTMDNLQDSELYKFPTTILERSRFIPLRITQPERKLLRLLEAALHVSKYSDKVDQVRLVNKPQRLQEQLKGIASLLNGVLLATQPSQTNNYSDVLNTFKDNEAFLQSIFEIARRYKIMNPDKFRDDYAKLIFAVQDSSVTAIKDEIGISLLRPVETVHRYLKDKNMLKILEHPLINVAVAEIIPDGKSRVQIREEIKKKEMAIKQIGNEFGGKECSVDEVQQCLYSIADNNCFLRYNRDPVVKTLNLLETYFDMDKPKEKRFSLAIDEGAEGARLSHNHQKQYLFVKQTLLLWKVILENMYQLWILAEMDLFDPSTPYDVKDTGQGFHRVQQSPRISLVMHRIVGEMQKSVENWVGSSVIHLGDHNVPNALVFIDKYTQISRFLGPIITTLENLEKIVDGNEHVKNYVLKTFNSLDELRQIILTDFFRHAFDGSGADNFYDAGSCIDGRLTSAWNWCKYYPIFQLAGFTGFDGAFS